MKIKRLAEQRHDKLVGVLGNHVAPNRLSETQIVTDQEDTSVSPLTVSIFDTPFSPGPVLTKQDEVLVEAFVLPIDNAKQFQRQVRLAEYALHHLRADCYEIWSAGHNVNDYNNGGFHIADAPTGPVTTILNRLNTLLVADGRRIAPPPFNHDKISAKKHPVTTANGIHLDSFEGMRTDDEGRRRKIWRYFFNLSTNPRFTLIAPVDPEDMDIVPITYSPTFLDPLFDGLDRHVDMLKVELPGADYSAGTLHGFKTTTTHLPHAEYGPVGDTLAVIDSLVD